jgi:hypothetical protein
MGSFQPAANVFFRVISAPAIEQIGNLYHTFRSSRLLHSNTTKLRLFERRAKRPYYVPINKTRQPDLYPFRAI